MIKLERFTNLNIIYGTDFTNQILKETALQFIFMMDENSAVYRLDGPKFGFILKGCGREKLLAFERRLREKLSEGIQVNNRRIPLKICAGAVLIEQYEEKADSLISKAAYALGHSETEHQGNLIIFNDEVRTSGNVDLLTILPEFVLNVNVSARQMERESFRAEVLRVLEQTGFSARHLCLELTERCRDMPLDVIKREVEFFQGYGIRMAMDDYGTGSASSGIVLYAPMDEIKLDMSFIRGITEDAKKQAMVRSIVEFANSCGMSTCLEGVETEELQNYLRLYQATWFQGYFYSRPVEIGILREMVQG